MCKNNKLLPANAEWTVIILSKPVSYVFRCPQKRLFCFLNGIIFVR